MQVYCDGRLVGNLTRRYQEGVRHIRLQFIEPPAKLFVDEGEKMPMVVGRTLDLEVKQRGCAIETGRFGWSEEEQRLAVEMTRQRYQVPENAQVSQHRDLASGGDVVRFRWSAVEVSLEDLDDYLFDHPEFEPV